MITARIFFSDGAVKSYEFDSLEELNEYARGCYPEVSSIMVEEGN